jgi:hypothetical protein
VLPSCFVLVAIAITVVVAVTIVVAVTNYQLCQFCGALSCSSDAPILRQFCGVASFSTLARV